MKATYYKPIKTLFSFSFIQKNFLQTLSSDATAAALSPLPTTPNSSSFTVQFLVNSCGLPLKSALSASQKLHLDENNIHQTQSLLDFLKSHHFNNTQIANLIKKWPTFLRCRVEHNLKPKFEFLVGNGFAGNLLPQFILSNPSISKRSLDSNIKPSFEFLKSVIGSNEKLVVAVKRCSWLLNVDLKGTVQPNVDLLIKEGVPLHRLAKLIISAPRSLLHKLDSVVNAVNTVKTLGLEPEDNMFIHALAVKMRMTASTWKKKIEMMKSFGWSEDETLSIFKRHPQILAFSEKKIRNNMDFLANTFQLELEIIFTNPSLLGLSVDKRIRPRSNVINVLKSKDLIEGDKKFHTLLLVSEEKFWKNYVVKYADDLPGLVEEYMGTVNTKKQGT